MGLICKLFNGVLSVVSTIQHHSKWDMIRQNDMESTLLQGPFLDLKRETREENKEIFNENEWCPI